MTNRPKPKVKAPLVDVPQREYTFSDGTTVKLAKIPPLIMVGVQSQVDKPEAPLRTIRMGGGGVKTEPREDDEPLLTVEQIAQIKDPEKREEETAYREYRAKLAQWETDAEYRMARVVFLLGVDDGPPADQVSLWRTIGFSGDFEIKYNWLASKLKTDTEMEDFFSAVLSQTIPTEEGIATEEARFPGPVAGQSGPVEEPGSVAGETEARLQEGQEAPA